MYIGGVDGGHLEEMLGKAARLSIGVLIESKCRLGWFAGSIVTLALSFSIMVVPFYIPRHVPSKNFKGKRAFRHSLSVAIPQSTASSLGLLIWPAIL